ncbi:hypothetical protein G9A89_002681 [Geosiphon pyriformis]|nr:hypothetical protein G9A89_002681 [Geosiphon pyriformis]
MFLHSRTKKTQGLPNVNLIRHDHESPLSSPAIPKTRNSSRSEKLQIQLKDLSEDNNQFAFEHYRSRSSDIEIFDLDSKVFDDFIEPIRINTKFTKKKSLPAEQLKIPKAAVPDISKRKENLLKDLDWVGIGSSSLEISPAGGFENDNVEPEENATVNNFQHQENSEYSDPWCVASSADSKPKLMLQDQLNSKMEATHVNSIPPLLSSSTVTQSINAEPFKWHQFLSSPKKSPSQTFNDRREEMTSPNQLQSDKKTKTIFSITSCLHDITEDENLTTKSQIPTQLNQPINDISPSVAKSHIITTTIEQKSIATSSIAWNQFLRNQINSAQIQRKVKNFSSDETSSIHVGFSPYMSPRKKKILLSISESQNSQSYENTITSDNEITQHHKVLGISQTSNKKTIPAIIWEEGKSTRKDSEVEVPSNDEKKEFSQTKENVTHEELNERVHNLEIKNAHLQLDMRFLKEDVRWLKEKTKTQNSSPLYHFVSKETPIETLPHQTNEDIADFISNGKICKSNGKCYPRIFEATYEFQEILEGQEVPGGLHIRVNINTGQRHAKLISATTVEDSAAIIVLDKNQTISMKESEKEEMNNSKTNFHLPSSEKVNSTLPLVSMADKPNKHVPQSDHHLFEEYIASLSSNDTTNTQLLQALDGLEELVHELDFGVKLARGDGIFVILRLLTHQENEVKKKAATVLGTAMQNNPTAQTIALQLNLVPRVLDRLISEHDVAFSSRLLYALSSIIRGNEKAVESFQNNEGLILLADFYTSTINEELQGKCAVFITDLFDPNMINVNSSIIDYQSFSMISAIDIWCKLFQETLFELESGNAKEISLDLREKALGGLAMIRSHYSENCPAQLGLNKWLKRQQHLVKLDHDLEDFSHLIIQVQKEYKF